MTPFSFDFFDGSHSGADPGFLERGFICIKVYVGEAGFGIFISFLLNIP